MSYGAQSMYFESMGQSMIGNTEVLTDTDAESLQSSTVDDADSIAGSDTDSVSTDLDSILNQKIHHFVHELGRWNLPPIDVRTLILKSSEVLCDLYESSLSVQFIALLRTPKSTWTFETLQKHTMNPRNLSPDRRRGCYLLIAIGCENAKEVVELYIGSSDEMAKRFQKHVSSINNVGLHEDEIQYFHRRCRELGVSKPFFIPVSYELESNDLFLSFQESGHIGILGTWEEKNVPSHRHTVWKVVQKMKLPGEDEALPFGWKGANCEIPFHPTFGRKRKRSE